MDKFLMICYVCADFGPYNGDTFRVTPERLGIFIEAPVWIKKTILFRWLVKDGSIKVADEQISRKDGENDPMKGMSAEGKDIEVSEAADEPVIIKTRTSRSKAKKDDAK